MSDAYTTQDGDLTSADTWGGMLPALEDLWHIQHNVMASTNEVFAQSIVVDSYALTITGTCTFNNVSINGEMTGIIVAGGAVVTLANVGVGSGRVLIQTGGALTVNAYSFGPSSSMAEAFYCDQAASLVFNGQAIGGGNGDPGAAYSGRACVTANGGAITAAQGIQGGAGQQGYSGGVGINVIGGVNTIITTTVAGGGGDYGSESYTGGSGGTGVSSLAGSTLNLTATGAVVGGAGNTGGTATSGAGGSPSPGGNGGAGVIVGGDGTVAIGGALAGGNGGAGGGSDSGAYYNGGNGGIGGDALYVAGGTSHAIAIAAAVSGGTGGSGGPGSEYYGGNGGEGGYGVRISPNTSGTKTVVGDVMGGAGGASPGGNYGAGAGGGIGYAISAGDVTLTGNVAASQAPGIHGYAFRVVGNIAGNNPATVLLPATIGAGAVCLYNGSGITYSFGAQTCNNSGRLLVIVNQGDTAPNSGTINNVTATAQTAISLGNVTIRPYSHYPAPGNVRAGTTYNVGNTGGTQMGTLTAPPESDVKAGVQYGAGGNEFTGTLAAGGGRRGPILEA